MLQIRDISKQYKTGSLVQKALDHVSLSLRDNEFVAILGPSGSGKTTLLNIIGGLDRYDSGDLIINGISTKRYKDRDWDSYRNHTIGFVFQSYNLIPHQTVLANVELALTISGISGKERRQRAEEALRKVGLGEQMHKKPNQMSGGQMQRVAIARALVNDPDILLADEPTGALDSETSVQVMDLLKEVASDRLVVMVTHNPELAEAYATRIVNLKDGHIISDSDPLIIDGEDTAVHKNMGRSSMSFLTALSLSFNNLRTKLTRTILVAFAGSIGIIGIALILSLSNGVNKYIQETEEETLSEYPLQIQSSSFDLTTMVAAQAESSDDEYQGRDVRERSMISRMLSRTRSNDLLSLRNYLEYDSDVYTYANAVEYTYSVTPHIYRLWEDGYRQVNPDTSFSPLGFGSGSSNSLLSAAMSTVLFYALPNEKKLYIDQYDVKAGRWPERYNECVLVLFPDGSISDFVLYALGLKDTAELDKMIESFMNEETVEVKINEKKYNYSDFLGISFKLANTADYYRYDEEYSVWVNKTDDHAYMMDLLRNSDDIEIVGVVQRKPDTDIAMLTSGIGYPYSLIEHCVTRSGDTRITQEQLADRTMNVFTGRDFSDTEKPDVNMSSMFSINTDLMANAFSFDTSKLQIDPSAFSDLSNMDLSSMLSPDSFSMDMSSLPQMDMTDILSQLDIDMDLSNADTLFEELLNSYLKYASNDPTTDFSKLPESFRQFMEEEDTRKLLQEEMQKLVDASGITEITPEELSGVIEYVLQGYPAYAQEMGYTDPDQLTANIIEYLGTEEGSQRLQEGVAMFAANHQDIEIKDEDVEALLNTVAQAYEDYAKENDLPDPEKLSSSFEDYLESKEGQKQITKTVNSIINTEALQKQLTKIISENSSAYGDALGKMISDVMMQVMGTVTEQISSSMQKAMSQMAYSIPNAISFDTSVFARAFTMTMTEEDMQDLMMSLMSTAQETYDGNLRKLGYADLNKPSMISIYPKDFEAKAEITRILDEYNKKMEFVDKDKVIIYTDIVGTLMSSVTSIVDTISYVLIAFVAISLVVSSIMIGVITYISVLERKKEIGILRAIGASKRNISEVFNAETFIIGLLAGLLGVGISRLLLIPGNYLIHTISDNYSVNAYLPIEAGVILITLSVVLTLIGGIIPSRKAAKSDPVTALRTE